MKKTNLLWLMLLLFSYPLQLLGAPTASKGKSQVTLTKAFFFVVDKNGKQHISDSIDYSKHSSYGWSIQFEGKPGTYVITEVIRLPGPANWGVGQGTAISTDQTSASSTYVVNSETPQYRFQNIWSYAPGDPSGVYTFDIYIDKIRIKRFVIDVRN